MITSNNKDVLFLYGKHNKMLSACYDKFFSSSHISMFHIETGLDVVDITLNTDDFDTRKFLIDNICGDEYTHVSYKTLNDLYYYKDNNQDEYDIDIFNLVDCMTNYFEYYFYCGINIFDRKEKNIFLYYSYSSFTNSFYNIQSSNTTKVYTASQMILLIRKELIELFLI